MLWLRCLRIDDNEIGLDGFKLLMAAVARRCPHLHSLTVAGNPIGVNLSISVMSQNAKSFVILCQDEGFYYILRALFNPDRSITTMLPHPRYLHAVRVTSADLDGSTESEVVEFHPPPSMTTPPAGVAAAGVYDEGYISVLRILLNIY